MANDTLKDGDVDAALDEVASEYKEIEDTIEMEYRMLGGTGLKVSALGFGFYGTYGAKEGLEICVKVLRICRKAGINFFDNAEVYGKNTGDAEAIMGKAIKVLQKENPKLWRRSEFVVTTKLFWGGSGANERGLSRKHIMEGIKASLERLQLDYVDILYCHRSDKFTSTEETVRAMTDVIQSGKALYWGTDEWSAQQITEAFWIAKMNNLIPPVVDEPQYNLFTRVNVEKEYERMYLEPYRIGTTTWSPLNSGILTGKYNKGIEAGTRLDMYAYLKGGLETKIPIVEKLMTLAKEKLDTTVACLAIAWCVKNKNVSVVLLGASKESQIRENLKALEVAAKLTPDLMKEIDEIVGNNPGRFEYGAGRREVVLKTNPL